MPEAQRTMDRRAAMDRRHQEWREQTLPAYLDWALADFADRPLLISDTQTFSYREVAQLSRRLAQGLVRRGVKGGDRVGLLMANDLLTVPLLYAVWRIGATAVPINTLYRAEELAFALKEADCSFLVSMRNFGSRNFAGLLDEIASGWTEGACPHLPSLQGGIIFDRDDPDDFLVRLEGDGTGEMPPPADPHDTAVIMFTSGTTGSPKGVQITHDNLLRAAYAGAYHQAFDDGRRAIFSLPLYHGFGLVVGLLSGMIVGGAIIPLLKFDPHAILTAIGRHRATYLMGVPTMTIALMEQAGHGEYDFSSLSAVHSAAAPTPAWVWQRIQQAFDCKEIITSYGQTEVTATVICTSPGDPIDIVAETQGCIVKAGIAGMPDQNGRIAEFKTVDPETGADLPWGTAGELCCRSPLNSKGYFRRPDANEELFMEGGWIRMGDLGQFRPDGNLFLTGRSKELYKSKGELVSPKELEQIVTRMDGISQAFFIGMPDDLFGECGCAWIVRSEGSKVEKSEIVAHMQCHVAAYKLPRDIWFIEDSDLPKTGTGKVQKAQLKEMALELVKRVEAGAEAN